MALSLPYYADAADIPAPIPTLEEIESATEILSKKSGCKVIGIGPHFVVKYGVQVEKREGETFHFLKTTTTVPAPRLYALFQIPIDERYKKTYIITERIQGTTLATVWPNMNEATKTVVAEKLRGILTEMRELESPGGYCSVGNQGLSDCIFWTFDEPNPFNGPFTTEIEFNRALVEKFIHEGGPKRKAAFYSRAFDNVFKDNPPVFAHVDLQQKNIMIRNFPPVREGAEDMQDVGVGVELVLVDWEYAGWYPRYWEYARARFGCCRWDNDWSEWLDQILEPYYNECVWMEMMMREMWG